MPKVLEGTMNEFESGLLASFSSTKYLNSLFSKMTEELRIWLNSLFLGWASLVKMQFLFELELPLFALPLY